MKNTWTARKRDNLFCVELKAATQSAPAVVREFHWGKDVPRTQAERESLLIVKAEAEEN